MNLQPGQIIHVRSRKYLVEEVVPPPEPADSPLVRLSCVEDDALGESLEVLWNKEIDAQVIDEANWQAIASRGFDVSGCGGSVSLPSSRRILRNSPARNISLDVSTRTCSGGFP